MDCTTKIVDEVTGETIDKPKKAFETNEKAIAHCKIVNALPDRKFKVVPYKCPTCYKFHVGRNGNMITDKERAKLTKPKGFTILGMIDLNNIKY